MYIILGTTERWEEYCCSRGLEAETVGVVSRCIKDELCVGKQIEHKWVRKEDNIYGIRMVCYEIEVSGSSV